jgi:hypothetical protein
VKIVLLSTGRGLRPAFINDLRASLALHDSDEIALVSWHRPRAALPVSRHLVLGPHLRIAGELATAQRVQQPTDLPPADGLSPADGPILANGEEPPAGGPTPESAARTHVLDETASLSVLHPRRMRQALAWRIRRLRRTARNQSAGRLTGLRTHPQFRRVRNRLTPGVSLAFAASSLRAGKVHDMIRDADLVVALDAASQRGAWTLAQRVQGPDIVIGIPAAKRLVEEHGASAPS